MVPRPAESEAAPYQFTYINRIAGDDPQAALERQLSEATALFETISEQTSLHRYQSDKWSIREVLSHITDTERIFAYRMLWFARGLGDPLPGFDQEIAARGANANAISWASHVAEFRAVRLSTLLLFRNMPAQAWTRSGTSSGRLLTVRALAYLIPGHAEHHLAILRQQYLG